MKNVIKLLVITVAMGAFCLSSDVFAGTISLSGIGTNLNASTASFGTGNVTGNPNNDNMLTLNPGTSMSIVPVVTFTSIGPVDFVWTATNSGGTSEYSVKSAVGVVTSSITNDTGITWTDFHWQLGFGTGSSFVPSTVGDFIDFDAPDRDPAPVSSVFTNVTHNANELTFTGGNVIDGASVTFDFNFDVPDLNNGIPSGNVLNATQYTFTTRLFPSDDFPVNQPVIPEPSTYILMGLGLAGAGLYRRFKK